MPIRSPTTDRLLPEPLLWHFAGLVLALYHSA